MTHKQATIRSAPAASITIDDISDDLETLRGMAQELDDMLASAETVEDTKDAFAEVTDVAAKAQELAEACHKMLRNHRVKAIQSR